MLINCLGIAERLPGAQVLGTQKKYFFLLTDDAQERGNTSEQKTELFVLVTIDAQERVGQSPMGVEIGTSASGRGWDMARSLVVFVFCFVAILGAVLGYAFRPPARTAPKAEETVRLSIPSDALNMGEVWEDDPFAWTVPIENKEAVPIEITSFSHTCNCLSIEPKTFVLGPGEQRELHLQIDLLPDQRKPGSELSISMYPGLKTAPGTELANRRPPKWTVKGQVRRVLALDRSFYLGRHSEFSQPLPPREIPIEILVPLESLSVRCGLPNFAAYVELPSHGQGKTVLRLTQSAPLPAGPIQGTITLLSPVLAKLLSCCHRNTSLGDERIQHLGLEL